MEQVTILRQHSFPPDGTPISSDHISNHFYPYSSFPRIESHLHPKFVIYNAGHKLFKCPADRLSELFRDFPSLASVRLLYEAWIRGPQGHEAQDPSFKPPEADDKDDDEDDDDDDDGKDSDYDDRTQSRLSNSKKRKAPVNAQRSQKKRKAPVNSQKKRKAPADKQGFKRSKLRPTEEGLSKTTGLSQATLSNHNRLLGEGAWTYNCVCEWSKETEGDWTAGSDSLYVY